MPLTTRLFSSLFVLMDELKFAVEMVVDERFARAGDCAMLSPCRCPGRGLRQVGFAAFP